MIEVRDELMSCRSMPHPKSKTLRTLNYYYDDQPTMYVITVGCRNDSWTWTWKLHGDENFRWHGFAFRTEQAMFDNMARCFVLKKLPQTIKAKFDARDRVPLVKKEEEDSFKLPDSTISGVLFPKRRSA
jgi:hypothetical protein